LKPVTLHAEAEAELREALAYYEGQRTGLADEFRQAFEAALNRLCENPQAYAAEDASGTRYCPLRPFPCTLVYVELEERVWVAAVAHQKRPPRY
jgi:toxin ParE1/3/4